MSDVTDDHTKKRRRRDDQTRCLHDDLTKGQMDSRIQYENAPSRGLPRRFWRRSRSCCRSLRMSTGDHTIAEDAPTNDPMVSRAEFENFFNRVSILCQLQNSVTKHKSKTLNHFFVHLICCFCISMMYFHHLTFLTVI